MNYFEFVTSQSVLLLILSIILSYLFIIYHWNRRWLYYYSWNIPGPFSWPIIGNALAFSGGTEDILDNIMAIFRAYKPIVRVWLGHRLFYGVSQPQDLEIILNKALEKERLYEFTKPVVGNGLFTAPVIQWKKNRKIIVPTFNQKILNSFVPIFAEQSNILVEKLNQFVGKGFFDVFPVIGRCSLDIICETAMGKKIYAQSQESDFVYWVSSCMELVFMRMFQIWFHPYCFWRLSPFSNELNENGAKVTNFVRNLVTKKREEYRRRKKLELTDEYYDEETPKRKAFLDYVIELSEEGENLTDDEIIDEAITIVIAGSDSSGSMDSFALIMLGMYPNIQDKVYEELYSIFGDSDRDVEVEDLNKMIYLERVIKETLRLFPVGPVIVRALTENIKLESYTLPKGSSCVLGILQLHRNPEIWDKPLKFNPDRFLPEEVVKRHPYAYIPFSGGPRNCIGPKYSMMAMKAVLSTILRYYKFTTSYKKVDDIKLRADLMIRCVGGYQVAIEKRNQ